MILVEHLTHIYAPGTPLALTSLEDVSLRIEEGEFVVLAGATGSGKTTLVQHFNGLLLPTAGRVLVDGRDTRDKLVRQDLWRTVGLLFQNPEQQLFEENVFAEVAFGCRNLGLDEGTIEVRVRRALEMVGLDPAQFGTLSPFALSQGQRRRVALASVLAYRPRVLILDEPTSGLDPAGREQIWQLLKAMQQHDHTVVVITHHMEDAARYADRVVVLHRGKIYCQGPPRQVFGDPEGLRAVGLDVPMPCELMYRLRQRGLPVSTGVLTLDEAETELKKLVPHEMDSSK
ncbi:MULTISPECIES: energy-coupling factor transporter ATPase [Desulfofundulus]|uniref:Energy-coupling factor transporter ATP-binding protein EcfA2 n=2 Tax=Desulfofundulus TaxID=2282741 RepID=A0A494WSS3_9FIRM|nr:energy-coupling factor transporter ATPase [Desulfofundulus salinum]AEG16522.1 Polyamine-transporting ATPase [Desulfofundulus kuznetsovii DSM 6115]RKO65931.1 energy-coupling factor transporter ATPase [Desulfofundulus salinum]